MAARLLKRQLVEFWVQQGVTGNMPRIARFAFIYPHSSFDTSLLLIYIDFFVLARAQGMSCDGKPGWSRLLIVLSLFHTHTNTTQRSEIAWHLPLRCASQSYKASLFEIVHEQLRPADYIDRLEHCSMHTVMSAPCGSHAAHQRHRTGQTMSKRISPTKLDNNIVYHCAFANLSL